MAIITATRFGGERIKSAASRACLLDLLALMLRGSDFDEAMRDMALMSDADVREELTDWLDDSDPEFTAIARKWGIV